MTFTGILAELKSERDRIDRAISAIEGLNSAGRRRQVARRKWQRSPAGAAA